MEAGLLTFPGLSPSQLKSVALLTNLKDEDYSCRYSCGLSPHSLAYKDENVLPLFSTFSISLANIRNVI